MWNINQNQPSAPQRSSFYGSLKPDDILITPTYSEQTRLIGWENFLRGQISKLWGITLLKHHTSAHSNISSVNNWPSKLISCILVYLSAM